MRSVQPKIDALNHKLSLAASVRQLQGHPGWEVVADVIRQGIENRKAAMLSDDCGMEQIKIHRALIRWSEELLRTPEITDDQMDKWRREIAFLVDRETMLRSFQIPSQGEPHEVQG